MSFKENLLKKIEIDALTHQVRGSIGPSESGRRIDKDKMVRLLDMGGYRAIRERDLDLYILEGDEQYGKILVLDNDLAIYHTSVSDVALRKSPYIKEMLSIRGIRKILNDADVVISRKDISVKTVQAAAIEKLDLSYTPTDIKALAQEGITALQNGDVSGVREALRLFSELLHYETAPKPFAMEGWEMAGALGEGKGGEIVFDALILYRPSTHTLRMIEGPVGSLDREKLELLRQAAKGEAKPAFEGPAVFTALADSVSRETV